VEGALQEAGKDDGACPIASVGPQMGADGRPVELGPGLFGMRLALPFALDHVNVWLLAGHDGWTIVDTGLADEGTRALWRARLSDLLADRPVSRLLATHFHPDHMGLAGWLAEETRAEFWTSRTEWLYGRLLSQDTSEGFIEAGRDFDRRAGLPEGEIARRAGRGNAYRTRVVPPPAAYRRVRDGDRLLIGDDDWHVMIGQGHAPEMVCLFEARRNVLIAGDQVLPRISPNVSVFGAEPLANPLAEFLASLERFRELPDDCLVLPSHGRPFRGLRGRIDQLIAHHKERLDLVLELCSGPQTVAEIMPGLFRRKLDAHQLGFAIGETLAHVNYLVESRDLRRCEGDDGRLYYERR
jgi:glyoxylase-like metal-dependent hydrolase (beta-lactamase superfamily II)